MDVIDPKSVADGFSSMAMEYYRGLKYMSREDLGNAIGVSSSTIYRIENDITKPNYERLLKIANALDVTVYDLMEEDD